MWLRVPRGPPSSEAGPWEAGIPVRAGPGSRRCRQEANRFTGGDLSPATPPVLAPPPRLGLGGSAGRTRRRAGAEGDRAARLAPAARTGPDPSADGTAPLRMTRMVTGLRAAPGRDVRGEGLSLHGSLSPCLRASVRVGPGQVHPAVRQHRQHPGLPAGSQPPAAPGDRHSPHRPRSASPRRPPPPPPPRARPPALRRAPVGPRASRRRHHPSAGTCIRRLRRSIPHSPRQRRAGARFRWPSLQ